MSNIRIVLFDILVLLGLIGPLLVVHWHVRLGQPWALTDAIAVTPFTVMLAIFLGMLFVKDEDLL